MSRVQVHPTRLFINTKWPLNNPVDDELLFVEDWLGFELTGLPETSTVSCGYNCGALCDFCNQMRPDDMIVPDPLEQPCCRMKYHHVFNNPIGGTRIPLDLHICEACMNDYVCLQIQGQSEPGYFTEHEENEEEEDLTDDPTDSPTDDDYASSFQRWFNLMRRNRRDRRATIRRSPNDDRDDVDGSENTASETDIGNFPPRGLCPHSDPIGGDPDPEPDAKRQRVSNNETLGGVPSSSSGSVPPLINVAAAIPCAAAAPLSLASHPLYQRGAEGDDNHADRTEEEDTNDQQTENRNRDHASASRREGSPFQ